MKTLILLIFISIAANFKVLAQESLTLTVKVEGVKESEGILRLAIFNNKADFLNKAIKEITIDLKSENSHIFEVHGLSSGEYAFSVIHDKNENGELDMGMMGPTEPYGFSNDARGMFGPADYEDALMKIDGDKTTTITIK